MPSPMGRRSTLALGAIPSAMPPVGAHASALATRTEHEVAVACLRHLAAHGHTLATAESCTGGLVGALLTAAPGSSSVFVGGVVTYADRSKAHMLGVPPAILAHHGAVSAPVARAMASGARARLGSDVAVAITGIAGPGGGSAAKPVGLVYVGVATALEVRVRDHRFQGDRNAIRRAAARAALVMAMGAGETESEN